MYLFIYKSPNLFSPLPLTQRGNVFVTAHDAEKGKQSSMMSVTHSEQKIKAVER